MSEVLAENIRERFEVDNDMKAEWCLNKIRKARAEQKRDKDELQRQMQFYVDQMEMIDKKADEEVKFFESMLLDYFQIRENEGFTKSTKTQTAYKLPTGKLVRKKQEPKYERTAELLPWLEQNRPDLVKVEKSADWAALKKEVKVNGNCVVTADGEIVPGVAVTQQEDRFIVEV